MWYSKSICIGLLSALPFIAHGQATDPCEALPAHQQKDEATIHRIETAWNLAISRGDSSFERCLLTADFAEILSKGEIKSVTDELGFTDKNKGKNRPIPNMPAITVLIHGNVAIAYATWVPSDPNKKSDQTSDFFVWENGAWHVLFSQSTPIEVK
jgi:hypothetical protein